MLSAPEKGTLFQKYFLMHFNFFNLEEHLFLEYGMQFLLFQMTSLVLN